MIKTTRGIAALALAGLALLGGLGVALATTASRVTEQVPTLVTAEPVRTGPSVNLTSNDPGAMPLHTEPAQSSTSEPTPDPGPTAVEPTDTSNPEPGPSTPPGTPSATTVMPLRPTDGSAPDPSPVPIVVVDPPLLNPTTPASINPVEETPAP